MNSTVLPRMLVLGATALIMAVTSPSAEAGWWFRRARPVVVVETRPAVRSGVVVRSGPNRVWVKGHYVRRAGGKRVWIAGHYSR